MPARGKLFYGWVIVAVMGAAGALSMAMGTLNYGLFIKPMGDDLGIGRSVFGWAQTMRQVASAVTSPLVGSLIDRFGSRVLLAVSAGITGAAVAGLGLISEGWQLVVLFTLMGIVGMSGPGALITSVPVAKWFVRRRGQAMSSMSLGIPVGGVLFIPLTQILIDGRGWREAWVILAAMGVVVIVPLSLLFVRREPEDMGLHPDGDEKPVLAFASAGPSAPVIERACTRQQAVRSPVFWQLTFVFSLVGFALNTVAVHRIPHFVDQGLEPRLVSYATALDAAAAGLSLFGMGLLADRIPARFLGAIGYCVVTAAVLLTTFADTVPMMFLAMFTFGAGIGGLILVQNYVWADYFGRAHLGSIRGVVTPITLLIGGLGAPLAGYIRDESGSYTGIWLAAVALFVVGTLALALTPPPADPPTTPQPRDLTQSAP